MYSPKKYIIYLFAYERPQAEKLAVDAMQHGLEEVTLPGVLAVEQLEQLQYKLLVDHALANGRLEV